MSNQWYNPDGIPVKYGRANKREENQAVSLKTFGNRGVITIPFDLAGLTAGTHYPFDLDNDGDTIGSGNGFASGSVFIPDQAFIEEANIYMTDTGAAGGTSVAVGLFQQDGTAIDLDGLVTASEAATANIGANAKVVGNGADVDTAVTEKAFIALTTVGTYTAGKGVVEVVYTRHRFV